MNNTRILVAAVQACLLVGGLPTAHAQAPDLLLGNTSSAAPGVAASEPDKASAGPPGAKAALGAKRDWHVDANVYLWLPGVHGNIGAFGYNLSFKASPADLLSHANFGLMGVVAIEHKRFL